MTLDPKAASAIRNGFRPWVVTMSRRTDIALHLDWVWDKIVRGGAYYQNPCNKTQIAYCSLDPRLVRVFQPWTKDPVALAPWIPRYQERGLPVSVFCTITGYPEFVEPGVPRPDAAVAALQRMHRDYGVAIKWRYDPVFLARGLDAAWHVENVRRLAGELAGTVTEAVTSFVQVTGMYKEIEASFTAELAQRGMPYHAASPAEMEDLLARLSAVCASEGIALGVCCHPQLSAGAMARGCTQAACISMSFLRQTRPDLQTLPLKPTREHCLCHESRDIGALNRCQHGCIYCYANRGAAMCPETTPIPPTAPWLGPDPLPPGYPYPVTEEALGLLQ
ncbi:MAG TPA: DUF1848 family protein [Thermoanaerobaculaceae bacterium]|nr:DUF1848 family protein [Thermoanaerobaculaceae bacterium]HPS76766.1 DUF1848 family protein [Thermoanaerobaculaceae bacterium]